MIRNLIASSALVALISAGAISVAPAQTDPAKPAVTQDTAAAPDTTTAAPAEVADSTQPIAPIHPTLASAIIGRSVYSSTDPESDNIGDVNDLIVDEKGEVTHAIVGVGGFLGIGEKNVAVPFDQLKVVENNGDFRLVYDATKDQLKAEPAFDRTAYDPAARAPQSSASNETGMAPVTPAATDTTAAPAANDQMAAPATDTNAAPAQDQTAKAPASTDTSQQMAASNADTNAAAPATGADTTFVNVSADQIRGSTLIGKSVYGPENESIGEISDLVLEKEGNTRVALIDVGGFLGIGEKTVAIPFTDLKFAKAADADANAAPQVNVAMTKEQLTSLPEFDKSTLDTTAAATVTTAPATTEQPAGTTADNTMAAAPATTDMTAQPAVTGSIDAATPVSQDISANQLMGAEVYGMDNSDIGEVNDIVFDMKGDIKAIVVDVGGFLGIGEKPVALTFANLSVRKDENGKLLVTANATKDQLDKAQAYQVTAK